MPVEAAPWLCLDAWPVPCNAAARVIPIKGSLLRTRSRLLLIYSMQAAMPASQRLNTQYFVQGLLGTI